MAKSNPFTHRRLPQHCPRCGKPIQWAEFVGRPTPFDVDPAADGVLFRIYTRSDAGLAPALRQRQRRPWDKLYTRHEATCPARPRDESDRQLDLGEDDRGER